VGKQGKEITMKRSLPLSIIISLVLVVVFCSCDPNWYRYQETVWTSTEGSASLEFRYGLFGDYTVFYIDDGAEYALTFVLATDCNEFIDWELNGNEDTLYIRTYNSNRFAKATRLEVFFFSQGEDPDKIFGLDDENITKVEFTEDSVQYELDNSGEWIAIARD
jgi:hypothetical protein